MRSMCPHSIPVFLGNAGIGVAHGPVPPQIRNFDVYYKLPIVVGFHVMGSTEILGTEIDFTVQNNTDNAPQVIGFYGMGVPSLEQCDAPQFSVEVSETDFGPKVLGFYALAVAKNTLLGPNFLAQLDMVHNGPQIIGLYAIEVT